MLFSVGSPLLQLRMEAGSKIPVKSRCNSLDWDSDSRKTGTVKRRPISTEFDSKNGGKVSDTDSGIHSPLSPGSVYGVFKPDTVCASSDSVAKLVCTSCKLERVKVRFFPLYYVSE